MRKHNEYDCNPFRMCFISLKRIDYLGSYSIHSKHIYWVKYHCDITVSIFIDTFWYFFIKVNKMRFWDCSLCEVYLQWCLKILPKWGGVIKFPIIWNSLNICFPHKIKPILRCATTSTSPSPISAGKWRNSAFIKSSWAVFGLPPLWHTSLKKLMRLRSVQQWAKSSGWSERFFCQRFRSA